MWQKILSISRDSSGAPALSSSSSAATRPSRSLALRDNDENRGSEFSATSRSYYREWVQNSGQLVYVHRQRTDPYICIHTLLHTTHLLSSSSGSSTSVLYLPACDSLPSHFPTLFHTTHLLSSSSSCEGSSTRGFCLPACRSSSRLARFCCRLWDGVGGRSEAEHLIAGGG